jgi:hypothetical protein
MRFRKLKYLRVIKIWQCTAIFPHHLENLNNGRIRKRASECTALC